MQKTVLPSLMLVTQRARMKPDFLAALQSALRGGARFIQLRDKGLPWQLVFEARLVCRAADARLVVNSRMSQLVCRATGARPEIYSRVEFPDLFFADGVHLPENAPPLEGRFALRGVSCHSLESARRAVELGADYLVFGSIFETQSHPGAAPAGLEALREVCAAVEVPVFAIGGVTAQNARLCLEAGAHGIAVIGAAWDAEDVEVAVRELTAIVEEWRDMHFGQSERQE